MRGGKEGQARQSKREAGAEFLLCSCDVYRTGPILLFTQYCLCGESLCLCNVKTLYYVTLPQFLSAMCLGAEDLCRCDVMFLGAGGLCSQDISCLGTEGWYPSDVLSDC